MNIERHREWIIGGLVGFLVGGVVLIPYATSKISEHRAAFVAERPLETICPSGYHLAGWYDEDRGDGVRHDRDVCTPGPAARPIHWRTAAEAEAWIASSGLRRSTIVTGTVRAPKPRAATSDETSAGH